MSTLSTDGSTETKTPTEETGFAPPTADEKRVTDALYERPTSASTELYPVENRTRDTLRGNLTKLSDRTGMSLEAQATERQEYHAMLRASGLHEDAVLPELLHTAWTKARLDAAQPDTEQVDPDAALAALNEATRRALREQYGDRDAEELLQRVQKFARQHPKLATILRDGAVGSRLDVIEALIDHVKRVNFR